MLLFHRPVPWSHTLVVQASVAMLAVSAGFMYAMRAEQVGVQARSLVEIDTQCADVNTTSSANATSVVCTGRDCVLFCCCFVVVLLLFCCCAGP